MAMLPKLKDMFPKMFSAYYPLNLTAKSVGVIPLCAKLSLANSK
jgi:hypothetical protein